MPAPAVEEVGLAEVPPPHSIPNLPLLLPSTLKSTQEIEDKTLVSAGR